MIYKMSNFETLYSVKKILAPAQRNNIFFQPKPASSPGKLKINNPNDQYEKEADSMADKVIRMEQTGIDLKPLPVSSIQRSCTSCEEEEKRSVQKKELNTDTSPGLTEQTNTVSNEYFFTSFNLPVQKKRAACEAEKKDELQRKETDEEELKSDGSLENYVGGLSAAGNPLPDDIRNFYEPRFGFDFSAVKIHSDAVAAKSAQSINALAYTTGNNIVFNNGQYSPGTESGKHLLAHELTHVVQQSGTASRKSLQRWSWLGAGIGALAGGIVGGLLGGGLGAVVGAAAGGLIGGLLGGLIGGGSTTSANGDLPPELIKQLQPAIQNPDAAVRQKALEVLYAWTKQIPSLSIQWDRVSSIQYDASASNTESGMVDANDPMNMKIWIGPEAFVSVPNLYSVFRHELVHIRQHHEMNVEERGWGIQEVYSYLWELENAKATGLTERSEWGVDKKGNADVKRGLARVIDGLFRSMLLLGTELENKPDLISQEELQTIKGRIGCALLSVPWEVVHAVYSHVTKEELQKDCNERLTKRGVQAGSSKCNKEQRESLDTPASSCCTTSMINEIEELRGKAIPVLEKAYRLLFTPGQVSAALENHFKVQASDHIRIIQIRDQFKGMIETAYGGNIRFMCRDKSDSSCRRVAGAADNCPSTPNPHLWICGYYDLALNGEKFFADGKSSLKTLIHEYAHTGCTGLGLIQSSGNEIYSEDPKASYPPPADKAVKNADSSTIFIVGKRSASSFSSFLKWASSLLYNNCCNI